MHQDAVMTLVILGVAIVLFISEKIAVDLVALLVAGALGALGILTPEEVFSGFSRSAVVILLAIFVMADGLERTGATEQVGNWLIRISGRGETRLVIVVMAAGAVLSLCMNTIAAAAVLMPVVLAVARTSDVSPSRVMMPLAFGTLLGGMATLLTTTNIVVSGLLRGDHLQGFGLLDFAPVGIPLTLVGMAYMAVWGRRMLPVHSPGDRLRGVDRREDIVAAYELDQYIFRARVPVGSKLIGQTLAQAAFRDRYNVSVVGVVRRGERTMRAPAADQQLAEGDVLVLAGEMEEMLLRDTGAGLDVMALTAWQSQDIEIAGVAMMEAVLSPRSRLIGQTLRDIRFQQRYDMTVLAIWRAGRQIYVGLADLPLEFGDALLLQGPLARFETLSDDPDLILLSGQAEPMKPIRTKGRVALAILGLTFVVAAIGHWPPNEVLFGGAVAMVLSGVLTMEQAYRAIGWRTVVLIAGMLPLGIAMSKTGAAQFLAEGLLAVVGGAGPLALLAGLVILAVLLSQTMHGAVVSTVIVPVAIQAARNSGINPRALAMGVALATSMCFLTPLGHPVNILVMGEGGYRFRDYFRVGLPLTIILVIALLLVLPFFWPLVLR